MRTQMQGKNYKLILLREMEAIKMTWNHEIDEKPKQVEKEVHVTSLRLKASLNSQSSQQLTRADRWFYLTGFIWEL